MSFQMTKLISYTLLICRVIGGEVLKDILELLTIFRPLCKILSLTTVWFPHSNRDAIQFVLQLTNESIVLISYLNKKSKITSSFSLKPTS